MADLEKSPKARKINEVIVWRVVVWSLIVFAAGAYAMHQYDGRLTADKQAAVKAAVTAATTPTPGK